MTLGFGSRVDAYYARLHEHWDGVKALVDEFDLWKQTPDPNNSKTVTMSVEKFDLIHKRLRDAWEINEAHLNE